MSSSTSSPGTCPIGWSACSCATPPGCGPSWAAAPASSPIPASADRVPFYEYFDGDNGRGVGASHQTGWTALVAKLLEQTARRRRSSGDVRIDDPDP